MERLDATQVALPNRVCLVPMACVGTCARRITGTCPSRRIEEDTILLVDDDGLFHHRSSGDFERLVCRIFIDIVIPVLHREKRRHKRMTDTILASNSANQQISKSAPKRIPKKKKMMKMMMMSGRTPIQDCLVKAGADLAASRQARVKPGSGAMTSRACQEATPAPEYKSGCIPGDLPSSH
ncbi:predicted protein [Plenodomus lingam JN3]|uniref:Predicted protein n=1 Tax=Leptosphaeria maculans (strain JN3 / isolate v23.1.3 / race Av1-4-5-6-7-8) TaxID=985895 RepID=E5R509_LEPMJ|nr:predicted protein [Plenodomus lingam JN3]CBX92282.1 predicted protein [Plenodomus lingam JN3]